MTANQPLAVVFTKNGTRTYVASNVTAAPLTVAYSDGTRLTVGPGKTATSGAISWSGGSATSGPGGGTTSSSATSTTASPKSASPACASPTSPVRARPAQCEPDQRRPDQRDDAGDVTDPLLRRRGSADRSGGPGQGAHPAIRRWRDRDGTPYQASVFIASGLTSGYHGGATSFALTVDSGASVGNAVQIRVS